MDALPPGRDNVGVEREEEENETQKEVVEAKDVEKGEVGLEEQVTDTNPPPQFCMSRMQRLSTTNPLRLVINSATRVPPVSCSQPPPPTPPPAHSRSTPTLQQPVITLNSRACTDKLPLFLFLLHMVVAFGLVCFLVYKGIQGLLQAGSSAQRKEKRVFVHFLPQVEAASLLSITLAFSWQKDVRFWPKFMVHFTICSSFSISLSAGIVGKDAEFPQV